MMQVMALISNSLTELSDITLAFDMLLIDFATQNVEALGIRGDISKWIPLSSGLINCSWYLYLVMKFLV